MSHPAVSRPQAPQAPGVWPDGQDPVRPLRAAADSAPAARRRLVIIGNGMAGYKLCEQLARAGARELYDITVFGEEPHPAYDRVHLTDVLAGRSLEDLTLASRDWYRENGIRLHTGHRVVSIDRARREIVTDPLMRCRYDALVFATGSTPYVPPIEGADLPGVFVYRTVDDLASIRRQARAAGSAAVVGGGLLGLEAVRALDGLGVACHVVEYAPHVLVAQLDETAGRLAERRIEELGIRVHANARLSRIRGDGVRLQLDFAGGDTPSLVVDMVVMAAGIRPRIDLARSCGLDTGEIGGILVDDRLKTSDPDVYAIGECAAHRGVTYGLVAPAYRMAETLAARLMGRSAGFLGADPSTRLKVLGVEVAVIGEYKQPGRIVTWTRDGRYRRLVLEKDRLIGASALGDWPEVRRMQDAVREGRRVWPWQLERFRRSGHLWKESSAPVTGGPATATACNCMNVSYGTLRAAIAGGCATPEALALQTGASSLCGACRPLLAALTGSGTAPQRMPGSGVLAGAGLAALAAVLAAIFVAPIPYPETVQASLRYDAIWRDGVWRQASGFTLLGLSLLGLAMSLRKRWKRFRWGAFGIWRALHGVLGLAGLVVLAAHTGMRPGHNLNAFLIAAFLGANVTGALAGAVAGIDAGAAGGGTVRMRRWLTWAHIAFLWPLPVLTGFHILAAYFF